MPDVALARHIGIDERDPPNRTDRKPPILLGEHVGGCSGVDETLSIDASHDTASQLFGGAASVLSPWGRYRSTACGPPPRDRDARRANLGRVTYSNPI